MSRRHLYSVGTTVNLKHQSVFQSLQGRLKAGFVWLLMRYQYRLMRKIRDKD